MSITTSTGTVVEFASRKEALRFERFMARYDFAVVALIRAIPVVVLALIFLGVIK